MKKLYMKVVFFFVSYDVHNKQILTRQFEKKKYDATNCIQIQDKF